MNDKRKIMAEEVKKNKNNKPTVEKKENNLNLNNNSYNN